ncbi:uncharacterized protein DEA37_0011888 [Paragonimus westermani]|uniref:Uncharacterized protein n=1 Tax=Paragonimus westermani TaxID=34504 RepID=A0A5J4ND54_9TREM|nr:uncharacterized protein DEA37_0011888 [Paragonimus westermani]
MVRNRNSDRLTTRSNPLNLLRYRVLRTSLPLFESAEVVHHAGNDLQPPREIVLSNLGSWMRRMLDAPFGFAVQYLGACPPEDPYVLVWDCGRYHILMVFLRGGDTSNRFSDNMSILLVGSFVVLWIPNLGLPLLQALSAWSILSSAICFSLRVFGGTFVTHKLEARRLAVVLLFKKTLGVYLKSFDVTGTNLRVNSPMLERYTVCT